MVSTNFNSELDKKIKDKLFIKDFDDHQCFVNLIYCRDYFDHKVNNTPVDAYSELFLKVPTFLNWKTVERSQEDTINMVTECIKDDSELYDYFVNNFVPTYKILEETADIHGQFAIDKSVAKQDAEIWDSISPLI